MGGVEHGGYVPSEREINDATDRMTDSQIEATGYREKVQNELDRLGINSESAGEISKLQFEEKDIKEGTEFVSPKGCRQILENWWVLSGQVAGHDIKIEMKAQEKYHPELDNREHDSDRPFPCALYSASIDNNPLDEFDSEKIGRMYKEVREYVEQENISGVRAVDGLKAYVEHRQAHGEAEDILKNLPGMNVKG